MRLSTMICQLIAAGVLIIVFGAGRSIVPVTASDTVPVHGVPRGPETYVALGASDTVGVGARHPAADNWTALLARHLPPHSRYVNLGRSGITLGGALNAELPAAVAAHPRLVTVWLAVNDLNARVTTAAYKAELATLLARLHRTGDRVYIGNVPDLRLVPAYASFPRAALDQTVRGYNTVIAAEAARYKATVVDLYGSSGQIWGRPGYISGDGFHPSSSGYVALAGVFYRVMHRQGAL